MNTIPPVIIRELLSTSPFEGINNGHVALTLLFSKTEFCQLVRNRILEPRAPLCQVESGDASVQKIDEKSKPQWYHVGSEEPPEAYRSHGPIDGTQKYLSSLLFPDRKRSRRRLQKAAESGRIWCQDIGSTYRMYFRNEGDYRCALRLDTEDSG